jgi:hypothetical protein
MAGMGTTAPTSPTSPVLRPKRAMINEAVEGIIKPEENGHTAEATKGHTSPGALSVRASNTDHKDNDAAKEHVNYLEESEDEYEDEQDDTASVFTDTSIFEQILNDDLDEFEFATGGLHLEGPLTKDYN